MKEENVTLIGWILFIVSAIGFIVASIGSFWAMVGSVFFLVACLVFLIPYFMKLDEPAVQESGMKRISLSEFKACRDTKALVDLANVQRVLLHEAPSQSLFRVVAIFLISHGKEGKRVEEIVEGYNAEQSYIGGAICAERAGIVQMRRFINPEIHQVVITTDSDEAISPGILCREYLTTVAKPTTSIVLGNKDGTIVSEFELQCIHPYPYHYRSCNRDQINAFAERFGSICRLYATNTKETKEKEGEKAEGDEGGLSGWSEKQRDLYLLAIKAVDTSSRITGLHPISYGAAVRFEDGGVESSSYLPALEYGATLCPVQLLCREILKRKGNGGPHPVELVQVDQYGTAHCPFASARSLLNEHFPVTNDTPQLRILFHDEQGTERSCDSKNLTPAPPGASFLTHDSFAI